MNILQKIIGILMLPIFVGCFKSSKTINLKNLIIHKSHLTRGWYPENQNLLNAELDKYFEIAQKNLNVKINNDSVKALIVPHAGLYYSGLCAASAYRCLLKDGNSKIKNSKIKKVIILAPSHTKSFNGICLPSYNVYNTVLGDVFVDSKAIKTLSANNIFINVDGVHENEHAIEIQFPFLQKTIKSFTIVPLIVGNIEGNQYSEISDTLKKIIDQDSLIVISSDFVHYGKNYSYNPFSDKILSAIRFVDSSAIQAITQKSFNNFDKTIKKTGATICGQKAIKIFLKLLESNILSNLSSRLSCYYTSAQIKNSRHNEHVNVKKLLELIPDEQVQNSVSYAGIVFTSEQLKDLKNQDRLTDFEKRSLLQLSRDAINNNFSIDKVSEHLLWPIRSLGLSQKVGAFVTLNSLNGNLKGCIGRTVTNEPLYSTVYDMSIAAAFRDSRFEPLKENELKNTVIDISVLTKPEMVSSYNDIVLGRDGIILNKKMDGRAFSALFLPQVPLSFGWSLPETLEHLSIKAGLGKDGWKQGCNYLVFQGYEIDENDFR